MPVTKENLLTIFRLLPDLFSDIVEQTNKATMFRKALLEQEAGN